MIKYFITLWRKLFKKKHPDKMDSFNIMGEIGHIGSRTIFIHSDIYPKTNKFAHIKFQNIKGKFVWGCDPKTKIKIIKTE